MATPFGIGLCGALLIAICGFCSPIAVAQEANQPPDFETKLLPFLKQFCFDCHSGAEAEVGVRFDTFTDLNSLIKQRKQWDRTAEQLHTAVMPPKDHEQPSMEQKEAFQSDLRTLFEYVDRNAKPDPGRVTMRRLNRVEYRNTVRDWIGIDFDPTEDFPSDDIGHGFDNIGDVLTLSPVLMERYLAAAESIASRAIQATPTPTTKRHLASIYTEPASASIPKEGNFRIVSSDGTEPIQTGPLHTPYEWEDDGEYIFRVRLFARRADGKPVAEHPVKIAVLAYGSSLASPDSDEQLADLVGNVLKPARVIYRGVVHADSPDKAEVIEVILPPMAKRERIEVALVKPAQDEKPVSICVEYLALEGPIDTRPASHRALLAHPDSLHGAEKTKFILNRWLRIAYRRPPTEEEVSRLMALVEQTQQSGESFDGAMQLALEAVLCSPKFLFRVELDDRPQSPESRKLDAYQIASRLSYFLWSTMPDERLRQLADNGTLEQNLDREIARMLADPRAISLVDNFGLQWLQLKRLDSFAPDRELFPRFGERTKGAALEETRQFLLYIFREDRSLLELIDANYTFLNEALARHYGIADTNGNLIDPPAGQASSQPPGAPIRGSEFRKVQLPAESARGGLLTQASILAVTSNPTRTSPVKRGRWILEQILGAPPPPPPPNVPELAADAKARSGGSLRQRMEQHRENPACANCHAKMDPLGFALENYDAVGRFRTKDGDFPIDPAGALPDGSTFQGMSDLKKVLRGKSDEITRCLAEKMMTYALGRGVEYYDRSAIEKVVQSTKQADYKMSALIRAIVTSEPFLFRRGSEETADE